jgi:hypothetical protein
MLPLKKRDKMMKLRPRLKDFVLKKKRRKLRL